MQCGASRVSSGCQAALLSGHGVDHGPTLLVGNIAAGETLRLGLGAEHFRPDQAAVGIKVGDVEFPVASGVTAVASPG